uniref:Phospholipase-like protein n=1 Tax=Tanacetum cinerariifolium TaxID=118510 RepID=A0A699I0E8_TANCI|nr:phospholipase-like protein [Tanacetum cinerariifolium]
MFNYYHFKVPCMLISGKCLRWFRGGVCAVSIERVFVFGDFVGYLFIIRWIYAVTREEFCLVTGLRFGVENKEEYDTQANLPFRRPVFSSHLDGQPITGIDVANAVAGPTFTELYDDDSVGLYCLGILQLVLLGAESRRNPTNEDDPTTYSIFGYTWAFKTWILESFRVTAIWYFDRFNRYPRVAPWSKKKGRFLAEMVISFFETIMSLDRTGGFLGGLSSFKGHANSLFFNMGTPSNFQTSMRSQPGLFDWQRQMPEQSANQYWQPSPQPGSYYSFGQVPSHIGRPNLQTTIETQHVVDGLVDQNILNRGKRQQLPSKYLVTPFTAQPSTTMVPKQCVSKNKNKGKKANLSPANLRGVLEGYNEEDNNVTFFGSQFTGNILFYENVDPAKIYLDCYMRGYIVPVTFWQELAPYLCMPDTQRLSYGTPIGWFGGEHMNSWMELMIRRRPLNANWTVAYTSTISVHPENNQFIILKDPHVIGTLDGSTRPYPSWNDVDWVFLPIHVAGNHWATGVIHLVNSHFYVFDSMFSRENNNVISQLIKCWTPVLNHILKERGCLNKTRGPYNF